MEDKHIKNLCINGVYAAVFVVFTMVNPLSWSFIQLRLSDLLSVLPYYKKQFVGGFLIGGAIANFFSPLGAIDIICGVSCEAIPVLVFVYGFGKNAPIWIKDIGRALSIGIIIGVEFVLIYNVPFIAGFLSLFVSEIIIFAVGVVVMKPILGILKQLDG